MASWTTVAARAFPAEDKDDGDGAMDRRCGSRFSCQFWISPLDRYSPHGGGGGGYGSIFWREEDGVGLADQVAAAATRWGKTRRERGGKSVEVTGRL
jgi:hypothetical protein